MSGCAQRSGPSPEPCTTKTQTSFEESGSCTSPVAGAWIDPRSDAECLAELRRSAAYRKEQRAAQAEAAKPAASAPASPLEQQCQALWTQVQRARSTAKG